MTTQSQPNRFARPSAREHHALPGEISVAVAWLVFYAIVLIAPVAAKLAPVGTALAFVAN